MFLDILLSLLNVKDVCNNLSKLSFQTIENSNDGRQPKKPFVKRCCVVGCYSTYQSIPKPSFYRFPQLNIEQRKLWIKAVNKKKADGIGRNWTPLFTTRICSVHFVTGKHSPTRGHVDYVPSIFPDSTILSENL